MKRFVVFPFVLGICGALFLPICWVESILAQYPIWKIAFQGPAFQTFISRFLITTFWLGLIVGATSGIYFAFWDRMRNGRNETTTERLPANLFWCLLYATFITALDCTISNLLLHFNPTLIQYPGGPLWLWITWLIRFTAVGALLLNFTAILWAAIRSIQTDDVLTPRVLLAKLRERARLQ